MRCTSINTFTWTPEADFFTGSREHRELIDQHAAEGWRYVGFFPTAFTGHGGISIVDLVFEREMEASP